MEKPDRHGFDRDGIARRFIPATIGRRAVTVSVSAATRRVRAGQPVAFTVELANRLPVSVAVPTPTRRLWSWGIDGLRAATEETAEPSGTGTLRLLGRERRQISREWNGLFGRTDGGRTRWVEPEPGEYELAAWIATDPPCARDAVRIEVV